MGRILVGAMLLASQFFVGPSAFAGADVVVNQERTPYASSVLYFPDDGKPHAGIIVLHGSEGGSLPFYDLEAQFLASQGYASLAFCWYNCRKDPITSAFGPLENVELRNTIDAIKWLKTSSHVSGMKIVLAGFSRGAEQALILASLKEVVDLVDVVAVHTPADKVVGGVNWSAQDKRCWVCSSFDLVCFNGTNDYTKWDWTNTHWNPSCGTFPKYPSQMTAWLLDGVTLKVDSEIEIEKFGKPVFITVGDQDELWDYHQTVRLKERLEKAGQHPTVHIFPGEHHNFSLQGENRRHDLLLDFLKQSL